MRKNVIDSKSLEHCSCEKPVPTFSRKALKASRRSHEVPAGVERSPLIPALAGRRSLPSRRLLSPSESGMTRSSFPLFRHPALVPAARHAPQAHKAGGQKEAPRLPRGAFAHETKKALRALRKASGCEAGLRGCSEPWSRCDEVKTTEMGGALRRRYVRIGKRCGAAAPPFSPHPQGAALLCDCCVVLRSKPEGLRPRTPRIRAKSPASDRPHGSEQPLA
ncbi:hypothetical protein SAMN05216304_10668 [Bosea sp. OK403]|nr:hypothetical protein SAMN05216304_10668 [Bosea sp. OK403]